MPAIVSASQTSRDARGTGSPEYPCYNEAGYKGSEIDFSRDNRKHLQNSMRSNTSQHGTACGMQEKNEIPSTKEDSPP